MLDDASLFLSKHAKYQEDSDLHTLAPRLFLDYKKECLNKKMPAMTYEDFFYFTIEWLNQNIQTIN